MRYESRWKRQTSNSPSNPGNGTPVTSLGGSRLFPRPTQVDVIACAVSVCHQLSKTGTFKVHVVPGCSHAKWRIGCVNRPRQERGNSFCSVVPRISEFHYAAVGNCTFCRIGWIFLQPFCQIRGPRSFWLSFLLVSCVGHLWHWQACLRSVDLTQK